MKHLNTLAIQAATIAAVLGLDMGHSYLIDGYGLHPMLAGAIATALLITPYLIIRRAQNV